MKMELSGDERVAVEKVRNGVKGFVDYKVGLDSGECVGNWKGKLEKEECEIEAEKKMLNGGNETYKSEN
ncbi:hypothetical protein, partial [Bacillus thuringiensis]|uniref:hypothetical protein n=1 Tax=Bacillus thuringiensis TaxID=1428 RepID=UPI00119EA685